MIEKISISPIRNNNGVSKPKQKKTDNVSTPVTENKLTPSNKLLQSYYNISFTGAKKTNKKSSKLVTNNLEEKATEIYKEAQQLAKKHKHKKVEQIHILRIILDKLLEVANQYDKSILTSLDKGFFSSPDLLETYFGSDIFTEDKKRELLKDLLKKEKIFLDKKLAQMPKETTLKKLPELEEQFAHDILIFAKSNPTKSNDSEDEEDDDDFEDDTFNKFERISDHTIFNKVLWPSSEKIANDLSRPFFMRLAEKIMKFRKDEPIPMEFYTEKSREIWKNLNVGTNMFVLYEPDMGKDYMLDTFESVLKDKNETFGKFNQDNTTILRYNKDVNADFVLEEIKKSIDDKKQNYVFVFDYHDIEVNESESKGIWEIAQYFRDKQKYPNLNFIITAQKDKYYNQLISKKEYKDFSPVTIPLINVENAKKIFKKEKSLLKDTKKEFSPKAIDKIVEASDKLEGYFPQKAQRIFGFVARYYTDKNKITEKDATEYIKQTKEIFKSDDNESGVKVVFDTKLKLKDIVGFETTKKIASSLVRQIKSKSTGTKGYILYSLDGTSGAGRKHTAKAIAGEAKIPFLEINAIDFATKDVSIFGSSSTPEGTIKKLFSMAKTQAETNPHKALILYINNFEYFSCGDQVTEYHEKAMSQILKEMEVCQNKKLNILVIGSVGNPDLIGTSTQNSDMFNKKIGIESPGRNKAARKEIIKHYIKENKIKLNVQNEAEKEALLETFANITEYCNFAKLKSIVSEFKNITKERGKKLSDNSDFIEALLQNNYGVPNADISPMYSKEMTTSHECGHAVNFTIMNEITKSLHPWYESSKVGFITLDPRGYFAGCVYPSHNDNNETSFHNIFAELVTLYGGYSCENRIYDVDGSYGITADMKYATSIANDAVGTMGIGHYFGKKSIDGCMFLDEQDKRNINKDTNVLLRNAQLVSDMITEEYEGFIKAFTEKHSNKVGTGKCVVDGEQFRKELNEWRNSLPEKKKQDLLTLNNIIKDIMIQTKEGKLLDGSDKSEKQNFIVLQ